MAKLIEALDITAALENGAHGDEDTAEQLLTYVHTVENIMHKLLEVIQTGA